MKIVNTNIQDTGGQCRRLSDFINGNTNHTSLSFVHKNTYIDYKQPHYVLQDSWKTEGFPKDIINFWKDADILHSHVSFRGLPAWPKINPKAGRIIHQHGVLPRGNLRYKNKEEIWRDDSKHKAIRVVSTLNLLDFIKGEDSTRWFPTPVNIESLEMIKSSKGVRRRDSEIRIMHSPTNRAEKNTDLFLKVIKELSKKYDIQLVMVENASHTETQIIRANCDIVYDQLKYQYGSNALEAMAMGIPAVVGCTANPWVYKRFEDVIGYVPFTKANKATLKNVLEQLIVDSKFRRDEGRRGARYVNKWHSRANTVRIAIDTYEEALR